MATGSDADVRAAIGSAARVVVKVGSSSLTADGRLSPERLDALVDALAAHRAARHQVVLVSSGAIAAGIAPLGRRTRPRDLATQQAAASVGQQLLAERYAGSFGRHGLLVGQVLLTADDLHRRGHFSNARRTMDKLLQLGVIPIVNENDTVATHEIRFGDNDRLAALVANLVHADALILLSDVDGLYDGDPRRPGARLIPHVSGIDDLAGVDLTGSGSSVGSGGMATKVEAAGIATGAGIPVLLSSAAAVSAAMAGLGGTSFAATGSRTTSRLFWLQHVTSPRGTLTLDAGAVRAVRDKHASLLPVGVTAVAGDFGAGDAVALADPTGAVIARGLVAYDVADLPSMLGRSTGDLPADLRRELVHRDDIVLL